MQMPKIKCLKFQFTQNKLPPKIFVAEDAFLKISKKTLFSQTTLPISKQAKNKKKQKLHTYKCKHKVGNNLV